MNKNKFAKLFFLFYSVHLPIRSAGAFSRFCVSETENAKKKNMKKIY